MDLVEYFIEKNEKSALGRQGKLKGYKNFQPQQGDYDRVGRQQLLSQAEELERKGLIQVRWYDSRSVIKNIRYAAENIPLFYEMVKKVPPWILLEQYSKRLDQSMGKWKSEWMLEFGKDLQIKLENGSIPQVLRKEEFLDCMDALEKLDEPIYKRIFSASFLSNSKIFEKTIQSSVVQVARKFCPYIDDEMNEDEVLQQLYIETYSQQLYLKGELDIELDGTILHLADFLHGVTLNSETMHRARILPVQKISEVYTIENKANFEALLFKPNRLLLFSHGFFSPKEREFLKRLYDILEAKTDGVGFVKYYHSGDLDYGGIRIFQNIRTHIFPKLQPVLMNPETYWKYRELGYGMEIKGETLEKLKTIDEPELNGLKECLIQSKIGIEQECFLYKRKNLEEGRYE